MYFSSLLFAVTISQSTYSSKQASETGGFEFLFSGCDDWNGKERESNIESERERERERRWSSAFGLEHVYVYLSHRIKRLFPSLLVARGKQRNRKKTKISIGMSVKCLHVSEWEENADAD